MRCGRPGCGHAAYLDQEFAIATGAYNCERFRYVCVVGHSTYFPPPVEHLTNKEVARQNISAGRKRMTGHRVNKRYDAA